MVPDPATGGGVRWRRRWHASKRRILTALLYRTVVEYVRGIPCVDNSAIKIKKWWLDNGVLCVACGLTLPAAAESVKVNFYCAGPEEP